MNERLIEKTLEWFLQQFKDGDDDLAAGGIVAVVSFLVDAYFFPGGMPSHLVGALYGSLAFLLSKWLQNRYFFVNLKLRRIDRLVERGKLNEAAAKLYKRKIIQRWLMSSLGLEIGPVSEGKTIDPIKKSSEESEEQQ